MKIPIPKTLLEPVTIPWFVSDPRNVAVVQRIKDALTAFFEAIDEKYKPIDETRIIDGQLHLSVSSFLKEFKHIAKRHGALMVSVASDRIYYRKEHIGNSYLVLFRVPHDIKEHVWGKAAWFGKKRARAVAAEDRIQRRLDTGCEL